MQKQITCNLNKSRLKQPNAGGVCYVTHFRTYIITHDRGQREAASISVFHLFINGIVNNESQSSNMPLKSTPLDVFN